MRRFALVLPLMYIHPYTHTHGRVCDSLPRTWFWKARSDRWFGWEPARPTAAWCSRTNDFLPFSGITPSTTGCGKTTSRTTLQRSFKTRTRRRRSSFWWERRNKIQSIMNQRNRNTREEGRHTASSSSCCCYLCWLSFTLKHACKSACSFVSQHAGLYVCMFYVCL